ncbi:hypothetical protein H2279_08095 [Campylobacter sp. B0100352/1]|uniref:hypothetical protein n=1 Tax=Campylobacter sp. B0100352/1 TaxID=2735783 RepID=UPI001D96C2C3|nr:hypothetical protein [Campylobacter sp. B0100352/1]
MSPIHTGNIKLILCEEAHFYIDYEEDEIENIPIIGAKVKIYDKDKKKLLYDNTANNKGEVEFSNDEIKDDVLSFYIELEHPDFKKEPIGGHVIVRSLGEQEYPIYFRRIKLRLKHAPFEKLPTPEEFKRALEVSDEKREHYQTEDGELSNDWNSLKTKAEELLARNEAIIEKTYGEEMKKANEQLQRAITKEEKDEISKKIGKIKADKAAKWGRHNKQKKRFEKLVKEHEVPNSKTDNTKRLKNFINKSAGADYAEWVTSLALLRHAPHLCHQRINADGVFKEDGIRSGKGSDPDFLITLEDKKRMIVEVKNYGYSSALNLTNQISYQLKCVRLYGMDYAIACNRSTEITDYGNNYNSVFAKPNSQAEIKARSEARAKAKEEFKYSLDFNKKRFDKSKVRTENPLLEEANKLLKDEGKGLRSALIRMYQEALQGSPIWVFIKRLNFRSNLGKINGEDFDLDKHFVNFYANLHVQDRKALHDELQVILEP